MVDLFFQFSGVSVWGGAFGIKDLIGDFNDFSLLFMGEPLVSPNSFT